MAVILKLNQKRISSVVLKRSASIVRRGGIIVYPTDTIYGLGCDARNALAIERVFRVKQRPLSSPALVLVRNLEMLKSLVEEISPLALKVMRNFWPGPLTLVFKARAITHPLITSSDGKIGIRIPLNKFCIRLISECRSPLLSTSANITGNRAISRIGAIMSEFGDSVDCIIDSSDLPASPPSSVVDVSGERIEIIREGAVPSADILAVE